MLRAVFSLGAITIISLALIPVQWLAVRMEWPLRRSIPTFYHRTVCAILGVHIRQIGRRIAEHPLLIVSNHSSWLDMSVITAVAPVVFVAKSEVAGWPVFGLFAKLQRSVFVDRTRHYHVKVQAPNKPVLTTQFYFPDEKENRTDDFFHEELVMQIAAADDALRARFDVMLAMR